MCGLRPSAINGAAAGYYFEAAFSKRGIRLTRTQEAAPVATLAPGPYTAIVKDKLYGYGVALLEIYNLDLPP